MANKDSRAADSGGGIGLKPGEKIGKYEVVERLAMGGQAIVYKCYDPSLDRHVAIKQISSHLAEDAKFLKRFRAEAKILARLGAEQPEVVTIHDLLEDPQGLFIVMDFVPGNSIEVTLTENPGPVEVKATLQILWRLCAALHSVHAAGIIHRDIKPSNIMIGDGLRPTITDFGVAATASGQTSMVLGTTKYMAPELFTGGGVDGRSDMYSLGMIAYEMLLGRAKFNEVFADIVRDRHAESLRWMKWHCNDQVSAPPAHEVNPAVPVSLSHIVSRMMAKNSEERFEGMEALGVAIKQTFRPGAKAAGKAVPVAEVVGPVAEERLGAEGEALEIGAADGSLTAPIPKRRLSLKAKLAVGITALVLLVGGLIALKIRQRGEAGRILRDARAAYKEARDLFDQGKFAEARKAFVRVRKEFPELPHADMSSVFVHVCRAKLAVADRDWDRALAEEQNALRRVRELQAGRPELLEWTRRIKDDIEVLVDIRLTMRRFFDVMAQARGKFNGGDADGALELLDDEFDDGADLEEAQQAELAAFRGEIRRYKYLKACKDLLAEAKKLREEGKLVEAQSRYIRVRDKLESKAAAILPAAERSGMMDTVIQAQADLKGKLSVQKVMAAVKNAQDSGDKERELDALRVAIKVAGVPQDLMARWQGRIKAIQEEVDFARVQKALAKGDRSEAMGLLKDFIAKYPGNRKAPIILKALEADREFRRAKYLAIREYRKGNYEKALPLIKQALSMQREGELEAAQKECLYRIEMAALRLAIAEKKYTIAEEAGDRARRIYPTKWESEIRPLLAAMQARKKVADILQAARDALKSKQYAEARRILAPYKALPAAATLISRSRYLQHVQDGREALGTNDLTSARANFNMAKNHAKSAEEIKEINALIQATEDRIKAKESFE